MTDVNIIHRKALNSLARCLVFLKVILYNFQLLRCAFLHISLKGKSFQTITNPLMRKKICLEFSLRLYHGEIAFFVVDVSHTLLCTHELFFQLVHEDP